MVDSLLDMYIKDSKAYRGIMADAGFHFAAEYLSVDYEGIIRITEDFEDMMISLEALKIDKGYGAIEIYTGNVDDSPYTQQMFVKLAGMCGGSFAHDTLCQYLSDCGFVKCQLAIAQYNPHFYDKVSDKSTIKDEVKSYFMIVA